MQLSIAALSPVNTPEQLEASAIRAWNRRAVDEVEAFADQVCGNI